MGWTGWVTSEVHGRQCYNAACAPDPPHNDPSAQYCRTDGCPDVKNTVRFDLEPTPRCGLPYDNAPFLFCRDAARYTDPSCQGCELVFISVWFCKDYAAFGLDTSYCGPNDYIVRSSESPVAAFFGSDTVGPGGPMPSFGPLDGAFDVVAHFGPNPDRTHLAGTGVATNPDRRSYRLVGWPKPTISWDLRRIPPCQADSVFVKCASSEATD
jgi:hypothetical protein